jgi:tripartite-type tricarboxylate transporter receptor subunit TctC
MAALARPLAMAPGIPPERVKVMRSAFSKAMKDPALLEEAKTMSMEISMMDGDQVQTLVNELVDASPAVLNLVRKAIQLDARGAP